MRWLVWLYPREWRRRYAPEMEAMLRQWRPGPRELFDLLAGAIDAHVNPQWSRHTRRRGLVVALGVLLAALASGAIAAAMGAGDVVLVRPAGGPAFFLLSSGQFPAAWLLAVLWLLAALCVRRLRARLASLFFALMAVRFTADWFLLPVALHLTYRAGWLALGLVAVALWGGVTAVVLRRSGLRWPVALAVGGALELLLGSSVLSLGAVLEPAASFLPSTLGALRIAAWAALLAWLAGRRRPRPWTDPPEGAPVPARPAPDPPEPLHAQARRAS